MCVLANPLESESHYDTTQKQTVEMRSPDGSADLYQLLAGLAVACRHGFEIENALEIAEKTYVNVNIHQEEKQGPSGNSRPVTRQLCCFGRTSAKTTGCL